MMFFNGIRLKIIKIMLPGFTALLLLYGNTGKAEAKDAFSYAEVGVTTSSFIVNPSIGFWWDRTGVRFSGMYVNKDQNELHFNIGYALDDTQDVQHSINLLTSWVAGSDPGAVYKYGATGIAYGLNFKGFFLEIGLAVPWRDDIGNLANDPVVPCGYAGYLYRFK